MNKTKYFLALQAFQFDISIYYSLATQFSLNWWCQSSISMNSGETKVDAIVFNSVKSGRKLEHWPPRWRCTLLVLFVSGSKIMLWYWFVFFLERGVGTHQWTVIVEKAVLFEQTSATRKGSPSAFKHLTMTNWVGCTLWSTVSIFTSSTSRDLFTALSRATL